MMNLYIARSLADEHRRELLLEARRERLAREANEANEANNTVQHRRATIPELIEYAAFALTGKIITARVTQPSLALSPGACECEG